MESRRQALEASVCGVEVDRQGAVSKSEIRSSGRRGSAFRRQFQSPVIFFRTKVVSFLYSSLDRTEMSAYKGNDGREEFERGRGGSNAQEIRGESEFTGTSCRPCRAWQGARVGLHWNFSAQVAHLCRARGGTDL